MGILSYFSTMGFHSLNSQLCKGKGPIPKVMNLRECKASELEEFTFYKEGDRLLVFGRLIGFPVMIENFEVKFI